MQIRPSLKFVKLGYALLILIAAAGYFGNLPTPFLGIPAVLLVFVAIRHGKRRFEQLSVVSGNLRYETGILSKSTRTIELAKVQDVRVDQSLFERMAGVGTISLETAGGSSRIVMQTVDHPQKCADRILELVRGKA